MPTNNIKATPTATAAGLDKAFDVNFMKLPVSSWKYVFRQYVFVEVTFNTYQEIKNC